MNDRRGYDKNRLKLDFSIKTPRVVSEPETAEDKRMENLCSGVMDRLKNTDTMPLPPFFVALTSKSLSALSSEICKKAQQGLKPLAPAFIPLFEAKCNETPAAPVIAIEVTEECKFVTLKRGKDKAVRLRGDFECSSYVATVDSIVKDELVSAVAANVTGCTPSGATPLCLGTTINKFYLFKGFKLTENKNVKVKNVVMVDTAALVEGMKGAEEIQFAAKIAELK